MIKICAGTKRLSSDPEDQPLLGDASAEFKVFLPKEKCQATTGKAFRIYKIWYFWRFYGRFGDLPMDESHFVDGVDSQRSFSNIKLRDLF